MGLMKKLTSAVVASSLVLGLVGTAFAAPSTEQINDAYARLSAYGIVQGKAQADGTVSPALGDTLTRAELVTILSRAFGQEETAKLLKGASSYSDVAGNEWYSGYVALIKNMAEQKGITVGYEDGTFRPSQNVKAIEALAFVMKLLGVQPGTGANWVADTIAAATDAGVITTAAAEAYLADPNGDATRGLAFALADSVFSTYQVAEGKTVYTTYVDSEAPALNVNMAAEPTTTATTYTITGSVSGAEALYLGSEKIAANEDGTFSLEVNLEVGANSFTFTAVDLAGNVSEQTFEITRSAGKAAKVAASLSSTSVAAGGAAELTVVVTDENGVELDVAAEDIKVTIGGEIGTYADGVFTAGTKAGTGTITVTYGDLTAEAVEVTVVAGALAKVVPSKESVNVGEKVTLTAQDEYGNAIEGATFTVDSTDAFVVGNVFIGSASGTYTVTASADGKTATATVGIYGATVKVAVATEAQMVANLSVDNSDPTNAPNKFVKGKLYDVTVKALDENGNVNAGDNATTVALGGSGLVFYAIDANGNTVTSAAITSVPVSQGVAKVKVGVLNNYPGRTITLTADDGGALVDGSAAVSTLFPVATSLMMTGVNTAYSTNDSATPDTITVTVLDQTGVALTGVAYEGTVTVSGPVTVTDLIKKTDTFAINNGTGAFDVYAVQGAVGDITITATVDGLGSVSKTSKGVIAGPAAKLAMSVTDAYGVAVSGAKVANNSDLYTFSIKSVDAQGADTGTNLPTGNFTVSFGGVDLTGLSFYEANGTTSISVNPDNTITVAISSGAASFKVKSSTYLGTLTASVSKTNYGSASASMSFKAGAASQVALSTYTDETAGSPVFNYNVPVNNPKTSVTAQLTDGQGNAVAQAGVKLTFKAFYGYDTNAAPTTAVSLNGNAGTVTVETDANGKATVEVLARQLVGETYTVKVYAGPNVTTITPNDVKDAMAFYVTDRIATQMTVEALVYGTTDIAGTVNPDNTPVNLRVKLKDQYGVPVTGQAGFLKLNIEKILWDSGALKNNKETTGATWTFYEDGSEAGTYWVATTLAPSAKADLTVAKAGLQSLGVRYTGVETAMTNAANVNVLPGALAAIKVYDGSSAVTSVSTTVGSVYGPLTVKLVDTYGNQVNTTSATTLTVTEGTVRTTADGVEQVSLKTYGSTTFYVSVPRDQYQVTITDGASSVTIIFDDPSI